MATSDDMSEKTYNEMIAKVPKDKLLGESGYLFAQANIGPTNAIVMGTKFSNLKKS